MKVRKWGDDQKIYVYKIYVYVLCIYVCVRRFCPRVGRLERPEEAGEDAIAGDGGVRKGWRMGVTPGRRRTDLHTVQPNIF
ncbi:hypothetical protein Hanom_Chr07g00641511 [Helianthus anomalus]